MTGKEGVTLNATLNRANLAATGGFKIVLDVPASDADGFTELVKGYVNKPLTVAFVVTPQP